MEEWRHCIWWPQPRDVWGSFMSEAVFELNFKMVFEGEMRICQVDRVGHFTQRELYVHRFGDGKTCHFKEAR